jgi:hypothetical protein
VAEHLLAPVPRLLGLLGVRCAHEPRDVLEARRIHFGGKNDA